MIISKVNDDVAEMKVNICILIPLIRYKLELKLFKICQLDLQPDKIIDPENFSSMWASFPLSNRITNIQLHEPGYTPEYAIQVMKERNIQIVASGIYIKKFQFAYFKKSILFGSLGVTPSALKFYVYGITSSGIAILAEVYIILQAFKTFYVLII